MREKFKTIITSVAGTKILLSLTFSALAAVSILSIWPLVGEAGAGFTDHPSASFGLTTGQAARLSVVNHSRARKSVEVQFLDEAGNVLKTARTTVEPRQTFGLLLPYSEIGRTDPRVQVRATVRMRGSASNRVLGGIEIYDEATGKTSFGLLLPASDFDPQPEPPSP